MTNIKKIALRCFIIVVSFATAITSSACKTTKPTSESASEVSLTISETELTLCEDETFTLEAITDSSESVKWSTNNKTVVSVSSQGRVIAKTVGEAVVYATVGGVTKECKVTVIEDAGKTLIELEKNVINLSVSTGAEKITGSVTTDGVKSELGAKNATFASDNEKVAEVSEDGTVTPISVGSALISVVCGEKTKVVSVEVYTMLVASPEDWNAMLNLDGDVNSRFLLTSDVDFTGIEYLAKPFVQGKAYLSQSFSGSLNGDGHSVKNITMPSSVSEQSLFGTVIGFNLENVSFENVRFTSVACGLAVRMLQHYDVVDKNGNPVPGKTEVAYNNIKNVSFDFVYKYNGASGLCKTYYGGGVENVFINMRMADGGKLNKNADYAMTSIFYVWQNNNYFNNVIVLAENGEVNLDWTVTDGSRDVSKESIFVCNNKMEACYKARSLFDSVLWTVVPGELPKLK